MVVAYKRCKIQGFDCETFSILENWSLRGGGRLRGVVATGGMTKFVINIESITELTLHFCCSVDEIKFSDTDLSN